MSSSSKNTDPPNTVEYFVNKLKEKRDNQIVNSGEYHTWDNCLKRARKPGETAESIKTMLDADHVQIDEHIGQTGQVVRKKRRVFPKNLKTLEEYRRELVRFRDGLTEDKSTYHYWNRLVEKANKKGATFESIKADVKEAKEAKYIKGKEKKKRAESPTTAAAATSRNVVSVGLPEVEEHKFSVKRQKATHLELVKKNVEVPKKKTKKDAARDDSWHNETPSTYGYEKRKSVKTRAPMNVSSDSSSTSSIASPQTSTMKATAAPVNKPQSKLPVPVTNTTSHSRSHPQSQSHSRSPSISYPRQQHRAVASEGQRPKTPIRTTTSASATTPPSVSRSQAHTPTHTHTHTHTHPRTPNPRASPRKTILSPITIETPRRASTSPGPELVSPSWLASLSPLNSPQKRRLSVSSRGASPSNQSQSNQAKQPDTDAAPPAEDTWDLGMFLEEASEDFYLLKNDFEMSNSFYDPFQNQ